MFAQIFGYFMQEGSPIQSPNVGYFIAAALCIAHLDSLCAAAEPRKSSRGSDTLDDAASGKNRIGNSHDPD